MIQFPNRHLVPALNSGAVSSTVTYKGGEARGAQIVGNHIIADGGETVFTLDLNDWGWADANGVHVIASRGGESQLLDFPWLNAAPQRPIVARLRKQRSGSKRVVKMTIGEQESGVGEKAAMEMVAQGLAEWLPGGEW